MDITNKYVLLYDRGTEILHIGYNRICLWISYTQFCPGLGGTVKFQVNPESCLGKNLNMMWHMWLFLTPIRMYSLLCGSDNVTFNIVIIIWDLDRYTKSFTML